MATALVDTVPVVVAEAPQTLGRALSGFRAGVRAAKKGKATMGEVERRLERESKPLLREALRETLQAKADRCPPRCPVCKGPLSDTKLKERSVRTQWGTVTLRRTYGFCARCQKWSAPADVALALAPDTQTSPDLAEKLAYLGAKLPFEEAAEVFEHLTGQKVSPSRLERETQRAGEAALEERRKDEERALNPATRGAFANEHSTGLKKAFTLVILMDGWMLRGREDWGQTDALRDKGEEPQRWHETKTARLYRIEEEDRHTGSRPTLAASEYVATREGPEGFSRLVYVAALRLGLFEADRVVILGDGGVWLWKIAEDRFPEADGTLDFYHAAEHLWVVGNALYGEGTAAARQWVEQQRQNLRHGQQRKVLRTLDALATITRELPVAKLVEGEHRYFQNHAEHLDYRDRERRGEPLGSGAIESACKQFQHRFKRCGQFWSSTWDEGLLELKARQLSGRWKSRWPHLHELN